MTQGGSQLERTRPCIRYHLDSAPTWAYEQIQNVLVIWQALRPGMLQSCVVWAFFTHAGLSTQEFIKSITVRRSSLYVIHKHIHPLLLCNSKETCYLCGHVFTHFTFKNTFLVLCELLMWKIFFDVINFCSVSL